MSSINDNSAPSSGRLLIDAITRLRDNKEVFFEYVRVVADLMDSEYRPVSLDDRIRDIWIRFEEEGVLDINAVDYDEGDRGHQGQLVHVGSVRKRDLAVILSPNVNSISQLDSDERIVRSVVSLYLNRDVPTLKPETSLFLAVETMLQSDMESLAVVNDDGGYLGRLSVFDLVKCFEHLDVLRRARDVHQPKSTRLFDLLSDQDRSRPTDMMIGTFLGSAKDVMKTSVISLDSEDKVEIGIKCIEQKGCRYICVVDRKGKLKGIASALEIQLALPPIIGKKKRGPSSPNEVFQYNTSNRDTYQVLGDRISTVMKRCSSVTPEDSIVRVAEILCGGEQEVLPVCEEDGKPIGLIDRKDLLRVVTALGELASKRGLMNS